VQLQNNATLYLQLYKTVASRIAERIYNRTSETIHTCAWNHSCYNYYFGDLILTPTIVDL